MADVDAPRRRYRGEMAAASVFVDLDRTLLRGPSGPVLHAALEEEGVVPPGRHLPGEGALYRMYRIFGESAAFIGLARAAASAMAGASAEGARRAGKRSVEVLLEHVQPFALDDLAEHRRQGRRLVLATTSPYDLVAPLAATLGFDDVVATRYEERDGTYTGALDGHFVWGNGKRAAVREWAAAEDVDLRASHAYSDSIYDLPLLHAVGHPHPLNPDPRLHAYSVLRRWPIEHWDRPAGVPSVLGFEPYHAVRLLFRPEAFPYARFDVEGVERIPRAGPVIIAANHRSYFDVAAIGIVAARMARPTRVLAKREIFDAPLIGTLARSLGGIAVDRDDGRSSGQAWREAEVALRGGDAVIVLPQGTIPRGEAFFDPVLRGHTGAVRLAAATGAPIVPVGVWGTEEVWPRSSRLPAITNLLHPPKVRIRVGTPLHVEGDDPAGETARLMAAIVDLLPAEAREHRAPGDGGVGPDPTGPVTAGDAGRLRGRAAVAARVVAVVNGLSRAAGRGSGTVIGGRAGIAVDPELLASLAAGRQVVLVTGTNGKTTTTGLLAAALTGDGVEVATNATGANMPPGHVAALVAAPGAGRAVLEVDESYLGAVADATAPDVIVLLNLSRDQLDRIAEVRMLVDRWREVLARLPTTTVVANADDPLVVHAASAAARTPVGAGRSGLAARCRRLPGVWRADRLQHLGRRGVGVRRLRVRPARDRLALVGHELVVGAVRFPMTVALPGAFNRANAAMAVAAATALPGVDGGDALTPAVALERRGHGDRCGRTVRHLEVEGAGLRLLLAKNPAGWTAIFDLFDEDAATPRRRWCCRSTPARPTASTPAGCGTSPSSAWPAAPWWRRASAAATWPSGCVTPRSTTPSSRPAGRPRRHRRRDRRRGAPAGSHRGARQLHRLRRPAGTR